MKLNKNQLEDLFEKVQESLKANLSYRLGQAFFNVLCVEHSNLAEDIRGTENDPFYNNKVLLKTIPFICDEDAILFWENSNIFNLLNQ